jgi:hypothetical protein
MGSPDEYRKRAPLPWRSGMESRVIEQLVWQWFLEARSRPSTGFLRLRSGQAGSTLRVERLEAGEPQSGVEFRFADGRTGIREADRRTPYRERPWAKYRVARFLGVSHTWVNKLVKRFEADPERMRRKMRAFAPASFEKLERAREETRRERERGWLRGPIRSRSVKVTLEGRKRKIVAATRAERKRRTAEVERERARLRQGYGASSAQAGAAPVRYEELPTWARGLLLPGDPGTATLPSSGRAGKPRAVPFAFRRRR